MPRPFLDRIGERYGKIEIIARAKIDRGDRPVWIYRCDCGNVKEIMASHLYKGGTKSCGCTKTYNGRKMKHGGADTREYKIWGGLRSRCNNANNPSYNNYGAKGIKVCERWENGFSNFLEDMGLAPSKRHTIDRIDNNGDYEPGNCRWATYTQQNNNKSDNVFLEFNGVVMQVAQWAKEFGVSYAYINNRRYRYNDTIADIANRLNYNPLNKDLYSPPSYRLPVYKHKNLSLQLKDWSKVLNCTYSTIYRDVVKLGKTLDMFIMERGLKLST